MAVAVHLEAADQRSAQVSVTAYYNPQMRLNQISSVLFALLCEFHGDSLSLLYENMLLNCRKNACQIKISLHQYRYQYLGV